jgi:predicted CXXCH cytochrome family protein
MNPALECGECHTCAVPTSRQPCLKSCPREQMVHQVSKHQLEEAPDSIVLDLLSDLYEPVHFNHKHHAGMAEMSHDCATCHHFSPPGRIPPCQDCHAPGAKSEDLTKPNLKGAYHRQCLSCHREWSHSTTCIICHKPSENGELSAGANDPTDIFDKSHPVITTPVKLVYNSSYKEAPIVTFQHKEHVELFGFRCVDCHVEESCGNCHDIMKTASAKGTRAEMHSVCSKCHDEKECKKCHDAKERPGFSHNKTGWPLGSYHRQLNCWSCHPAGRRIGRISRMCVNCHAEWNQENFRHAVVGLVLDEAHSTLDCSSCHVDYHYDKEPVCSDCHDDNRTALTAPPGVRKHPK